MDPPEGGLAASGGGTTTRKSLSVRGGQASTSPRNSLTDNVDGRQEPQEAARYYDRFITVNIAW